MSETKVKRPKPKKYKALVQVQNQDGSINFEPGESITPGSFSKDVLEHWVEIGAIKEAK